MKIKCFFLALLLLSFAFCQEDPGKKGEGYQSFGDSVYDKIKKEGNSFIDYGVTAAGIPATAYNSFSAFQPGYCGDDWIWTFGGYNAIVPQWIAPTFSAVMLVVFAYTLIYLAGQLFQLPKLIAFAKEEAYSLLMLVMLVAFLIGAILAANNWYSVRAGWGSSDPIYTANPVMIDASMAITKKIIVEMISDYSSIVLYNMALHTVYSSTLWFGVTWRAMYSFNLGPVLKPLIDILGMAMQYLGLGISEWMLHLVTLCMIKRWTWGLFIPFSILLHAIPQTRNAGTALLALFFTLSLFYPFMFILDYEVHKIMKYHLVDSTSTIKNFAQKSGLFGITGLALTLVFMTAGVFMPIFLGMGLSIAFQLVKNAVYYVVILSLLLPFINIFITLTAAKELAKGFGTEVNFLSLLKIL